MACECRKQALPEWPTVPRKVPRTIARHALCLVTAALLVLGCALPQPGAANTRKPVLLLFPSGGFVAPCVEPCLAEAKGIASDSGFAPRVVENPLGSIPAAMQAAIAAVPRHRAAFAYGESAGGLLAARLAEMGRVGAATLHSPVSDLPHFISVASYLNGTDMGPPLGVADLSDQRTYSPDAHRTVNPIFAIAAADDWLTPDTVAWARAQKRVRTTLVPGDHLDTSGSLYPGRVELLLGWLACRARTASCPLGHRP
jgi:acetyl esterase/lipase